MKPRVFRITETGSGLHFACRENEFIIEAMRRAGTGLIPYGCYGGGCGICKMQVVEGSYDVTKRMSRAHVAEKEEIEGIVLMCCVQPRSNLKIARIQ